MNEKNIMRLGAQMCSLNSTILIISQPYENSYENKLKFQWTRKNKALPSIFTIVWQQKYCYLLFLTQHHNPLKKMLLDKILL